MSAQTLIAEEPVRLVHNNKVGCDGGGGPKGHPKIWVPLDKPGVHACSTFTI
jgi:NADH dehydrogenase (ubiquinone) Fe-S protein 6